MKDLKKKNLLSAGKTAISLTLLMALTYSGSNHYILQKYNTKNIFNNQKLKVTEEEADELFETLQKESGNYSLDDERDLILTAVIENPNLTDTEREVIFDLATLIEEMPSINKRMAYANLKKLDIKYHEYDSSAEHLGDYNYLENVINIYWDNENHDVLRHEILHSVFLNMNTYNLPTYFREGVTELLEDEYYSEEPYWENTSYPYEIAMVKILCDMVGSDVVLKAYCDGKMEIIEKELAIYLGKEEAKSYLDNIQKMFEQYEKENSVSIEYMSDFLETTNSFLVKKYPESNEVFDSYQYNKELLINMKNSNPGIDYVNYLIENGYYVKPYFSKELKEKDKKHYQKEIEGTITVESIVKL